NVALFETVPGFPADENLARAGDLLGIVIARYRLFWRAVRWADVVHYAFGRSILGPNIYPSLDRLPLSRPWAWPRRLYSRLTWFADLPLLNRMGKTLVVTWQGDDARQGDRSRELFDISIAGEIRDDSYYNSTSDAWKRRIIARFTRYAARQYALNPDLLHMLPAGTRFLPYASIDPFALTSRPPDPAGIAPLRFAHAPSHRRAKGTRYILEAVDRLRAEGLEFSFALIEGEHRADALKRLSEADVVLDQLLAGWYGGLGLEAMSLGKVLLAYIRPGDLKFVPAEFARDLPVVSVTPTTVAEVMRSLIAMPRSELHAAGQRSRMFAERYHAPHVIAEATVADYRNLTAPMQKTAA
ncbi:MAG: glycosyltransferase family 1 protein, partial [Alphaproteobacteria bacterium]